MEKEDQNRVVEYPEKAIREVIIGLNMKPDAKEEILKNCSEREIPVFQVRKKRYEFQLERVRII